MLPKAGDIVVMSECLSHAVLPWRADKPRLCLQLRYKCGQVLREAEPIQYGVHGSYPHWPEEVLCTVEPATRAIMSGDYAKLTATDWERRNSKVDNARL